MQLQQKVALRQAQVAQKRQQAAQARRKAKRSTCRAQQRRVSVSASVCSCAALLLVQTGSSCRCQSCSGHWTVVDPSHGNRHLLLLNGSKHRKELNELKEHWKATGGAGVIKSVHRIQNPALHRRYEEAKQELKQSGKKHQADIIAYHGTRSNNPAWIYDSPNGFNPLRGQVVPR